jgi:hypothetical protein
LVEMRSYQPFSHAGLEHSPPDFSPLTNWDYRCEPLHPVNKLIFVT